VELQEKFTTYGRRNTAFKRITKPRHFPNINALSFYLAMPKPPKNLSNAPISSATVIRDGIDGSPEVLIQEAYDAHDALNRVEARRFLRVAKHDIVLSIANRPTENGVCVAPYDVGAPKGGPVQRVQAVIG
jgi:hypothetical protein